MRADGKIVHMNAQRFPDMRVDPEDDPRSLAGFYARLLRWRVMEDELSAPEAPAEARWAQVGIDE